MTPDLRIREKRQLNFNLKPLLLQRGPCVEKVCDFLAFGFLVETQHFVGVPTAAAEFPLWQQNYYMGVFPNAHSSVA